MPIVAPVESQLEAALEVAAGAGSVFDARSVVEEDAGDDVVVVELEDGVGVGVAEEEGRGSITKTSLLASGCFAPVTKRLR